jgi:hypothetical protein
MSKVREEPSPRGAETQLRSGEFIAKAPCRSYRGRSIEREARTATDWPGEPYPDSYPAVGQAGDEPHDVVPQKAETQS